MGESSSIETATFCVKVDRVTMPLLGAFFAAPEVIRYEDWELTWLPISQFAHPHPGLESC